MIAAAWNGCAWPELRAEVDAFHWVGVLRMGQWIRTLHRHGCRQAIMVGRVPKRKLYSRWRYFQYIPDLRTAMVYLRRIRHDKRDQAVLMSIDRNWHRKELL